MTEQTEWWNGLGEELDGKNNRIYTIIGDGESDEGQVWEAAMTAAKDRKSTRLNSSHT